MVVMLVRFSLGCLTSGITILALLNSFSRRGYRHPTTAETSFEKKYIFFFKICHCRCGVPWEMVKQDMGSFQALLSIKQESTGSGNPWLADNQSRDLNNELWLVVYILQYVENALRCWLKRMSRKRASGALVVQRKLSAAPGATRVRAWNCAVLTLPFFIHTRHMTLRKGTLHDWSVITPSRCGLHP